MIANYFERQQHTANIRDFTDNFIEKEIPVEIRTDRFCDRVARVLKIRWKLPQPSHDLALIAKAGKNCPFCPQHLETQTPMFPSELVPQGRVRLGESVVIPNAFPYCQYCGVTIFAHQHYIPLNQLSADLLLNAVNASLQFFDHIRQADDAIRYFSINWNYMPTAGGSLFHPHFQVVANSEPTHFHQRLIDQSQKYGKKYQSLFWADLIAHEKAHKKRYLFNYGDVEFMASFCPGGIFGEVLSIFKDKLAMDDISQNDWKNFFQGITRILRCFDRLNLDNHNMTLLLGRDGDEDFWIQARIMPRISIPPWGTNDVNYFEKGHNEIVAIFAPEELAAEIRHTI